MPDLKTQLGDYLDHVVRRATVEDVFEQGADTPLVQPLQPRTPPRNLPGWLYGMAAALAILLVGVTGFLAVNETRSGSPEVPSPSATTVSASGATLARGPTR